MRIAGLTPCTSIDFPGRLAAVVFTQGCPWRCVYCHNRQLLDARRRGSMSWESVLAFLEKRHGLLDAVVFSGGEPTLQAALPAAMDQVRDLGFQVGLHTAGMYPDRLAGVLPLVDWVGLDVKAPWDRLDQVTGTRGGAPRVQESLQLVLASGRPHECRTSWGPGLYPLDELKALGTELAGRGVGQWAVQELRGQPAGALDEPGRAALAALVPAFTLRRA